MAWPWWLLVPITGVSDSQLFGREFDCLTAVGKLFSLVYQQTVGLLFIMVVQTGKLTAGYERGVVSYS